MIMSLVLFENEFLHIVSISFTALVLNELLMVALEITTWYASWGCICSLSGLTLHQASVHGGIRGCNLVLLCHKYRVLTRVFRCVIFIVAMGENG